MERDGSFKKQALSQASGGGGYAADGGAKKREPNKFMAWNANNFLLRLKSDKDEMLSLLHRLDPNVIAILVKKNCHFFFFLSLFLENMLTISSLSENMLTISSLSENLLTICILAR
jgi:hypothetical protein